MHESSTGPSTYEQIEKLRAMNSGLVLNVEELREELGRARAALEEMAADFRTLRDCSPSASWAAFAGEAVERIEKVLGKHRRPLPAEHGVAS